MAARRGRRLSGIPTSAKMRSPAVREAAASSSAAGAGSRILVERPIYRKFVDAMAEKAKAIKLGNGLDRATKMGPLVSREQFDRVRMYQDIGKKEAKVAAGGNRASGGVLDKGYFVGP